MAYPLILSGFMCLFHQPFDTLKAHLAMYLLQDLISLFQAMQN